MHFFPSLNGSTFARQTNIRKRWKIKPSPSTCAGQTGFRAPNENLLKKDRPGETVPIGRSTSGQVLHPSLPISHLSFQNSPAHLSHCHGHPKIGQKEMPPYNPLSPSIQLWLHETSARLNTFLLLRAGSIYPA